MNVENLMTRDPKTCSPADTLHRAAQLMWENDCGTVPIVDGGGMLVGIVTDRDVCMSGYMQGRPLHEISIESAMSKVLFTLTPSLRMRDAVKVFAEKTVRRLPVIDEGGKLVGILSLADVVRATHEGRIGKSVKSDAVLDAFHGVSKPRPAPKPAAAPARSSVLVPKPRREVERAGKKKR
jgi:CBS domain-containing protein